MLNRNKNKKIKSKLLKNGVKIKYTRVFCKITFNMFPSLVFIQEETDKNQAIGYLFAINGMSDVHGWFILSAYSFEPLKANWGYNSFTYWTFNGSDGRY